jgi:hypothetical protein
MPFEISATVNNLTDRLLRIPLINSVARDPLFTSLLIVFVIIIILVLTFYSSPDGESLSMTSLRVGFWSFFLVFGIVFLHNKVLSTELNTKLVESSYGSLLEQSPKTATTVETIPVNLRTDFFATK